MSERVNKRVSGQISEHELGPCTLEYQYEMGYSRREFLRQIQRIPADSIDITCSPIVLRTLGGIVHITLGPEQERRIGMVRLPQMDVRFCYFGIHPPQLDTLRKKIDLYFQKGGG